MKSLAPALLIAALLGGPAMAQQKSHDHSAQHASGSAKAATTAPDMADGEVRKVDRVVAAQPVAWRSLERSGAAGD